jgi:peptide/nickel transport system substrate-binding protein
MLLVALVAAVLAPTAFAQEDDSVVLRIGLTQDWETLNPISGFAVSEYEIWNIHYATLTNKAADDFANIPGLAESWEGSDDGLTYTYTLREGLTWSDGEPLTAEDVVWNINMARDQEWDNMISTVANLEATLIDDRTIEVTSSVPDPKLPTLDVYLVPKHIWEPIATDYDSVTQYDASDFVGSGPFVVTEFNKGESVIMTANPSYYGWEGEEPPIDRVVFRLFENPDAMVAALQRGELDAAHGLPAGSVDALEADPDIEVVVGAQGGFYEYALNGGALPDGQPHPALLDIEVRRAIGHAIDEQAIIEDLWFGLVEPIETISPGADLKWVPEIPEENRYDYDPDKSRQLLDEAGYLDSDGDGVREMPDGTPIVLNYAVNTDLDDGPAAGELFAGWMEEIGIGVQLESYDQDALFSVIAEGSYDVFYWDWVPFVDPDPLLSYFTEAELGNWNDANWFDPRYDELYLEQKVELDPDRRVEIVHEMLTIFHEAAVYFPVLVEAELQAYRTDTFEGWVRQPADVGPIIFSNSSPSYTELRPVTADGDAAGGSSWVLWGAIAAGVLIVAAVGLAMRRNATSDERE